jgi:phage recombination protein Bet
MAETAVEEKNQVIDVGQQDISQELEKKKNVIKNTLAKDANEGEFEMFMHLAKTYQLDPFQKEIFFWKYKGDTTIMTSRDGYLKIANRHPEYDGMDSGVIYPGDKFKKEKDGVKHQLNVENMNKKPIAGYAVVYRNDRKQPTIVVVPFSDYQKGSKVWKNYPTAMIQKVAESMALKRAFSVSGLVSKEEMDIEETPKYNKPQNNYDSPPEPSKDITPEPEPEPKPKPKPKKSNNNITLEKAKNTKMSKGKFEGKKLKNINKNYLQWLSENWEGEEIKNAAKKVYIWKDKQEDDVKKNDKNSDERELTEKEKEISKLVNGNEDLKAEVLEYLKEYNCKSVNKLDNKLYEGLKQLLESISKPSDEEIANEVDRALEEDEFDTPF